MKSLKNTDFLKGKSDSGAALALVLLMVIFLSLWLSSVFLVSASSKKAIDTNIAQAQLKDTNINAALQSALSVINAQSIGSTAAGYNGSCSSANITYTAPDGTVIQVQCNQAANSGVVGPIASFVLTGTNATCGSSCVTGVNGGLNIVSSTTANLCQAISKLKFSGGIFNSSGAFNNVNACTTQLDVPAGQNLPVITSPATTTGFSGSLPGQVTNGASQQVQPARILPGVNAASTNPDVNPVSNTTPGAKSNIIYDYLRSESQHLDRDGDKTNSGNLALISVAGGTAANNWNSTNTWNSGACSANTVSVGGHNQVVISPSGNTGHASFGRITPSMLKHLNELTGTGSNSCGSNTPIVFSPGTYRIVGDTSASATQDTYEWLVKGNSRIVGGAPVYTGSNVTDCNVNTSGVQLQFQNTFLTFGDSKSWLCQQNEASGTHHPPVISATRNGDGAEFSWAANGHTNSNGDDAFMTVMDHKTGTSGQDHEYSYLTTSEKANQDREGSDNDGKFTTWTSGEQNTLAASLHKSVAQLTSDDKLKGEAKRGTNDSLLNDSDRHYTVESCQVCVTVHGSILAPAGWANLWENSLVKWVVDSGMNFRAMTVHIDNESGNVARQQAGRAEGDRVVSLRYLAKTKGSNVWKPLGLQTVQILDYQGRHMGSGYKILSSNLNTNTNN